MANGYRLLVVEDDPALCETIADVLRINGYEVATAPDGDAALQALSGAPQPDAILLDLVLPRMSGERLLERIVAADRAPRSVVLMTGMLPSRAPAAADVLLKPFDVDELLARVARACGGAPLPA
jgi:DNA-binding response OmpR family regulator